MKNLFSILIVSFILAIASTSCKKENVTRTVIIKDTVPPDTTIIGFFAGKIGDATDYPSIQFSLLFRGNGTVRVYQGGTVGDTSSIGTEPAEGTYFVSGDTVNTTFTFSDATMFSTQAIIDPEFAYMGGSWGYGSTNNGGGYFFAAK
ncbi:MAG TPA: hypothetical protein VK718_00330 [Ferruginibacter sp.]|jgi:hypothetical protein|nr:hypothetical protein [Ferruginibacter sp.]